MSKSRATKIYQNQGTVYLLLPYIKLFLQKQKEVPN